MILNLAVNARDAMPRGGKLDLSTGVQTVDESYKSRRPEARIGRFVRLSVTDNGSGIKKEHLAHLFEPFFTTKGVGKGTGLGLATVYGIVKQHEGWIEVESEQGKGSTFHVFLPAVITPAEPAKETPAADSVRGGQETILVVEDEPAVRGLVRTTLQRYGYRVCTATSGAEALKVWSDSLDEIDLLITDVVMPDGVSGWELAKEMQSRKPELKVVYMSGYTSSMTVMESREAVTESDYFLQKPFNSQKLAEVVRACLDGVSLSPNSARPFPGSASEGGA